MYGYDMLPQLGGGGALQRDLQLLERGCHPLPGSLGGLRSWPRSWPRRQSHRLTSTMLWHRWEGGVQKGVGVGEGGFAAYR